MTPSFSGSSQSASHPVERLCVEFLFLSLSLLLLLLSPILLYVTEIIHLEFFRHFHTHIQIYTGRLFFSLCFCTCRLLHFLWHTSDTSSIVNVSPTLNEKQCWVSSSVSPASYRSFEYGDIEKKNVEIE